LRLGADGWMRFSAGTTTDELADRERCSKRHPPARVSCSGPRARVRCVGNLPVSGWSCLSI
jgi:hypothetical protein